MSRRRAHKLGCAVLISVVPSGHCPNAKNTCVRQKRSKPGHHTEQSNKQTHVERGPTTVGGRGCACLPLGAELSIAHSNTKVRPVQMCAVPKVKLHLRNQLGREENGKRRGTQTEIHVRNTEQGRHANMPGCGRYAPVQTPSHATVDAPPALNRPCRARHIPDPVSDAVKREQKHSSRTAGQSTGVMVPVAQSVLNQI